MAISGKHARGAQNQKGWHATPTWRSGSTFVQDVGLHNRPCAVFLPGQQTNNACAVGFYQGPPMEGDWGRDRFVAGDELCDKCWALWGRTTTMWVLCLLPTPLRQLTNNVWECVCACVQWRTCCGDSCSSSSTCQRAQYWNNSWEPRKYDTPRPCRVQWSGSSSIKMWDFWIRLLKFAKFQ